MTSEKVCVVFGCFLHSRLMKWSMYDIRSLTSSPLKKMWWGKAFDERTKNNFYNFALKGFMCVDEFALLKVPS
jgi:hypothetical protein